MRLNREQKSAVEKWAAKEAAGVLEDDWGEPFKDRDYGNPFAADETGLADAADEYFFVAIKKLVKRLRTGAKAA